MTETSTGTTGSNSKGSERAMMLMTRDEQIAAVMAAPIPICPCCKHGMDPHGADPGGVCGVGGCECLLTPSTIHWLLNRAQGVAR